MPRERIPGVPYDEYGRPDPSQLQFREPMDFVRYIDSLGPNADPASRRQADAIRRNPSGWVVKGPGQVEQKEDWLARNLPWLGPAVVTAGTFAAAPAAFGFGGPGGAASAAGGTPGYVPASMIGTGVPTGLTLPAAAAAGTPGYVPASMIGPNVPTGITPPQSAGADYLGPKPPSGGGRNIPRNVGEGASQLPAWQRALLQLAGVGIPAAIASRQNRPTEEERATQQQIQQMLASQQKRTTLQDPLYRAVTQLAMSRLPTNMQAPIGDL